MTELKGRLDNSAMSLGGRIREARNKLNLTQAALAAALGVKAAAVSQWEAGETLPAPQRLPRLAEVLNVGVAWLMEEEPPLSSASPSEVDFSRARPVQDGPRDLPVYGSVRGGLEGEAVDLSSPVDWTHRPPSLVNVPGGGALYVTGTSMEPRYEHGELVVFHPGRPLRRGCYVVIEFDDHTGVVKRFLRSDDRVVEVEQLSPPKKLSYPRPKVLRIWRIIRGGEE